MIRFSRIDSSGRISRPSHCASSAGSPACLIHLITHQQDPDNPHPRSHRQHQQLSRHHRDQPRWPLRRAPERRLRHAGDLGHAVDRYPGSQDESTRRLPRRAIRRRSAPELFPRPGFRFRRQTSLRVSRFHNGSDRTEAGNTGNGIAVYSFADGKVAPERFIAIEPQALAAGEKSRNRFAQDAAGHCNSVSRRTGAGFCRWHAKDRLLVANNLSDNVVLLDVASGKVLHRFDLSTSDLVPSSFPYTCVVTRDARRAWCSLWNASRIAELDLTSGKVVRWIKLKEPDDPIAPGSHPTALLMSPDEKTALRCFVERGYGRRGLNRERSAS